MSAKKGQCGKREICFSLPFLRLAVAPAGADLGDASPAAARRRALLRSAGMLGNCSQIWLIPSRPALGRSKEVKLGCLCSIPSAGARDESEAWPSNRKQPRIAKQCHLPRSGGAAPYQIKSPRRRENRAAKEPPKPGCKRSPLWYFLGLPRKYAPVRSLPSIPLVSRYTEIQLTYNSILDARIMLQYNTNVM